MQLIEVTDKQTAKEFIRVNVLLNKNDSNYIRPLDKDVNMVFDKEKNKAFRFGEAKRWILKDDTAVKVMSNPPAASVFSIVLIIQKHRNCCLVLQGSG